jgi:predicted transcriptional regulator
MNGVESSTLEEQSALRSSTMRKQFVLDKRTDKLLDELASYRGGNRSLVIREAIQIYSAMEDRLEKIEADPAFQAMMAKSDEDIRLGRVVSQSEVLRIHRALAKGKKGKKK